MEQLIETVRTYPVLYDNTHQDYLKLSIKECVWLEIADKLHYHDGVQAKTAWRKLRSTHRVALKRKEKPTWTKPWRYEAQMKFLIPFMSTRNKVTTENAQDSLSDNDNSTEIGVRAIKKQKRTYSNNSAIHTEISRDDDELVEEGYNQDASTDNDELYTFYMSIYNITKQLPLSRQIQLKRKIFNLAIEEQKQMCSGDSTPQAPEPSEHYFNVEVEEAVKYL